MLDRYMNQQNNYITMLDKCQKYCPFSCPHSNVRLKNFEFVTKMEKFGHLCPMDTFLFYC